MKLKIKSVLKSTYSNFECFDDQQIMFRSGNTLCVKEIGKPDGQFIYLSKNMDHLYCFKPTTNKKAVFTAEKSDNLVEVAQYNLKGERKAISLTDQSPFFAELDSIQLLVDEYDNNLVYGSAKSKESACVFLADFSKGKVLGTGYMPLFEDIKVDGRENMTLSICGNNGSCNFVKSLKYGNGGWEVEDTFYKKIHSGTVLQHQILVGGRMLLTTRQSLYLFEDTELIQTVNFMETDNKFISDLLKIPKGILVRLSNDCIKIFVEDSDEATMFSKGDISLSLNSDDRIQKMQISSNNEQVIIRTAKNNLYRWKCQNIDLQPGSSQVYFNLVESSCNSQKFGNISLSTGQKYCLLSGPRVVTLWSVQKNQFVLSSEYLNLGEPHKKVVFACAINPDGNSFMVAFEDRIKIFKVLLTKFKAIAEFPIKRCQNIVYSHGGQLVACRFGKGVNSCLSILNTLRLVELGTLKIQSQPRQIVWNELDDEVLVSTENNSLQYFNISENTRTHTIKFDNQISYIRIDYKLRKVLVSSNDKITVIEDGKIVQVIQPAIPNFDYVFPLYGIYLAASTKGVLYWSTSPRFQTFEEYPLFTKQKFEMISRSGYLLAYSSLDDVTILECMRPDHVPKKSAANEIVSVEHQQIIDFYDKVKTIEASFDKLQDTTQSKLEEEKNNYHSALKLLQEHFKQEIAFLNSKYSDITIEKLKQDRASEKIFESLESGQAKNVNELQKMYERKLAMEREKTMNLQQLNLQQKLTYEKVIYELESRFHREVSTVRDHYAKNIKLESGRADEIKKHHLEQKYRMEARLMNLEEQNEITLGTVQLNKDSIIENMRAKHHRLEEMNETLQIRTHNQQISLEELMANHQQNQKELKRLNFKLEENANRIRLLQNESHGKDQMLEERNQVITEQAHKIEELEKAKYVLSFRATQIRKQLEPKQTLTDKLRSELIKLDEEFKQEKRKTFDMRQKIDKIQKLNEQSRKQNTALKQSTKHKERIHDDLCSEIFTMVNYTDLSDWNNAIIKIYQSYIKEDKFKTRTVNKQKEEMSEQMNRHLNHVEQSLIQAAKGNEKMIKAKEKDITRKMKENSQLLYAINEMKKSEKEKNDLAAAALEKMKNEVTKIHNIDSNRNSTRAHTANTGGITKRVVASREAFSRQKESFLELHDMESARQQNGRSRNRNRISSAHKTILYQGVKRQQSGKIIDMAKQLQISRNTIKRQGLIIQELNQRLFALPEV